MNIQSSLKSPGKIQSNNRPNNSKPEPAEEDVSFMDKVVLGAKVTGASMLPVIGGRGVLFPLAFDAGMSGDKTASRLLDTATIMNYASAPLALSAVSFPVVGLVGAGVCLAASGLGGLYGAAKAGLFES